MTDQVTTGDNGKIRAETDKTGGVVSDKPKPAKRKRTTKPTAAKSGVNVVMSDGREATPADVAKISLLPSISAAIAAHSILQTDYQESLTVNALVAELEQQVGATVKGDLARTEAMLSTQAHTLNLLFNRLTRHSIKNSEAGYLIATEVYMRLAFRAQAQCRTTAETLSEMKNPRPVAFVQQANIAHGPQQVNNGRVVSSSRAEESKNKPNELLEQTHGQRLDAGTASTTIRPDTQLEAVGAVYGTENSSG